jgi:hypothetical protein
MNLYSTIYEVYAPTFFLELGPAALNFFGILYARVGAGRGLEPPPANERALHFATGPHARPLLCTNSHVKSTAHEHTFMK